MSLGLVLMAPCLLVAFSFHPAYGTTYSMTLQTDQPSYSGTQPIMISGVVSPAPGTGTYVVVAVKNPSGTVVDIEDNAVNGTTGSFSQVTAPSNGANWISGTFSVNATWSGNGGGAISNAVSFTYAGNAPVPQFPVGSFSAIVLVALALVAILSRYSLPRPRTAVH